MGNILSTNWKNAEFLDFKIARGVLAAIDKIKQRDWDDMRAGIQVSI